MRIRHRSTGDLEESSDCGEDGRTRDEIGGEGRRNGGRLDLGAEK